MNHLYQQKLPSEQTLCDTYGVSRTVIREALKILSTRGLIKVINGDGSYVTKPEAKHISQSFLRIILMDDIQNWEISQLRMILEIASARDAANHATEAQLNELEKIVKEIESNSMFPEIHAEHDLRFHVMLGKLSGNCLLSLVVESMTDVIRLFIDRSRTNIGPLENPDFSHRKILNALRTHDPDIVEEVLSAHLKHSFQNSMERNNNRKPSFLIEEMYKTPSVV